MGILNLLFDFGQGACHLEFIDSTTEDLLLMGDKSWILITNEIIDYMILTRRGSVVHFTN